MNLTVEEALRRDNASLKQWVNDLQSGMYINCVYCGHRYGPKKNTPVSMADVLKAHVEQCPRHPMFALKQENQRLCKENEALREQRQGQGVPKSLHP